MSTENRKTYAKSILLLYALITVTFPFAHKDYVPQESTYVIRSLESSSQAVDSNNDLVCPAHNFAQSTTGTAALSPDFLSQEVFHVVHFIERFKLSAEPSGNLSTRAPPQA